MARTPEKELEGLGMKKLSSTELEYMEIIWQYPEGILSEVLYNLISKHSESTRRVVLHKITEKGYIDVVSSGRHRIYRAKVSKEVYMQAVAESELVKKFGVGSLEHMVAAFCGKVRLSEKQKARLESMLEDFKNEPDNQ